ncbi:MAG: class I adenylate-forming enzyme family protein, partial [Myxococcota bacterium]
MERPSFLTRWLAVDPASPALFLDRWYTHGELRALGERTAGWLRERGVSRGDKVCIQLENGRELVAAHLGCMALGAVRVPLNAHYRAAEVAPIVEDAAPRLVIARDVSVFTRGVPVETELGEGPPVSDWPTPPDDVTCWLFTSGTTGRAKGAPQTYRMWEANLDALAERWRLSPEDRLWLCLPLFHTHGLVLGLHGTLLRGASAVVSARFDPVVPPEGTTHFYGVPTYYRRWLDTMAAFPDAFRRLKLLVSGSDGLPAELSDAVFARTGHRVLERYGMTETVMIASNPFDGDRRAGTVGTALPGVDVRIVDGEVQVRGPSVFPGYQPRPDPTAFTPDGFFRTGDAGELDDAGYLRIVGRKKDLVIVGGVNVSPAEVELHLARVPGVAEVGCCGLPDADLNEIVACAVVPDGSVPEGELRAALERAAHALSGLKRPKRWAFVPTLPRNALGKLQRGRIPGEVFGGFLLGRGGRAPPQRPPDPHARRGL